MERPSSALPTGSIFGIDEAAVQAKLALVQRLVAQPVPDSDPVPCLVGKDLYCGNKHHAADVPQLVKLGITAVLNCASSGIRKLPLDQFEEHGIRYSFTNVAQDAESYPILHNRLGACSEHLKVARSFYDRTLRAGGKALFICVAGQNRSAALAVAVQLDRGVPLEQVLSLCSKTRPFVLENVGFQRQLVELEALRAREGQGTAEAPKKGEAAEAAAPADVEVEADEEGQPDTHISVELSVPGLRTFSVRLPRESSIAEARQVFVDVVNSHFEECVEEEAPATRPGGSPTSTLHGGSVVGYAWLVFTKFGVGPDFDLLLEEDGVELPTQLARLRSTFGLQVSAEGAVSWTEWCRFELVVFSVVRREGSGAHEPFTFRHHERPGAQGSLLSSRLEQRVHLRSWDFVTGAAYRSSVPVVFSYSDDPKAKRDFMTLSTAGEGERQQFREPGDGTAGEGQILGMGNNAIVHYVRLEPAVQEEEESPVESKKSLMMRRRESRSDLPVDAPVPSAEREAAVKRPLSMAKMLAAIEGRSEAGMAKRLRRAGALNQQGRLVFFYGLGCALSSNNNNHDVYKFEAMLLSQYQSDFSSYTLKRFMDDYTSVVSWPEKSEEETAEKQRLAGLQASLTLIKVKVLLVSLLNGFRDLTLMGVQAFDFNHLNNVLISRDGRKVRLIDIDGASKGSIQFPSQYIGGGEDANHNMHKPALDVDLATLLPVVVQQLLLGKGRGRPFVNEKVSRIKRARGDEEAKAIIRQVLCENFFDGEGCEENRHLAKVTEWFYASLMKRAPWATWTDDVYDAMRCIDHLPVA